MKKKECIQFLTEKVHLTKKSAEGIWLYIKARGYSVLPVTEMDTVIDRLLKERGMVIC